MKRNKAGKKELSFTITDNLGSMDDFVDPEEIEIISPFVEKIISRLTSLLPDGNITQEQEQSNCGGDR